MTAALRLFPSEKKAQRRSKPYDLQTLYAQVYETERHQEYGRQTRDLRDGKEWLELYPDFFESETEVEKFQAAALNYLRSGDKFWTEQRFPLYGLLIQYHKFIPVKPKQKQAYVSPWDTCEHCGADYPKGTVHQCK